MGSIQEMVPIEIAIVGGGIGGLALSIGLQQYGHLRVKIYEAASKFSEIGAGVFFGANSIRAMTLIHPAIGEAFAKISTSAGWESKRNTYFDFVLAHELHGLPTGSHIISPQVTSSEQHSTAHRAHFVDELIKLVPDGTVEFGKRLADISRDEGRGKTIMRFADGSTAEADAVIGCDGIRSVCRDFVLGKNNPLSQPVFTGKHAYRGLIPMDKAIAAIGAEKAQNRYMFLGVGGHVLVFPVAEGQVMNVVAFSTTKSGTWEGEWVKPMKREDMDADFKGFGEECQKIFSLMENTDHWGIFDLSPDIPTFSSSPLRLLLLGDSAHACAPHQGAGAGQALEDAHILSHILGACCSPSDLLAAFAAYESVRIPRTKFVQKYGRLQGELLDLQRPDVGDDLEKLKAIIDVPIREIWNCDLGAELEKAQVVMERNLADIRLRVVEETPVNRADYIQEHSILITMPYLAHISLILRDYDEAIAFYSRLGFTVVEDTFIPEQQKRWVLIQLPLPPSSPSASSQGPTILLARAGNAEQEAFIGNQAGGRVFLFLATDDFDRDYKRFSEAGVEWVRPPKVEAYGKVAVWKDLYGNLWDLIQRY
ncbi:hypothetical protein VE03_07033 [Pseudogymnoascus sp. 23342-1-I1]|nr:hypothetical protein VE03_07033 [Pseudogymnoascus sp. 23342-1-I1]